MSNVFSDAATQGSLAASAAAADAVGNIARGAGIGGLGGGTGESKGKLLNNDGTITQTERLLTARSRSAKKALLEAGGRDLGGSRGEWAYIKLLTSQQQYKDYLNGGGARHVTWASELMGSNSPVANMADPSGALNRVGYDKFLLTGVQCQLSEKVQVMEVFGDHEVVYYFGRQPVIMNFSGVLIDSPDNNWFVDWIKMYSEILRGTKLAENYELLKIVLPNMAVTGTISGFSWAQDSNRDTDIPFQFQFIAKVIEPLPATADGMITSNKLSYVDFSKIASFTGISQLNSYKAQLQGLSSTLSNPLSTLYDKAGALGALGTGTGGGFGKWLSDSKGTLDGFKSTVEGWDKSRAGFVSGIMGSSALTSVTSALAGIRLNLISPIYGIMSGLMKLVSNSANSAFSLVNALVMPIRNLMRDITNISKQAVSLVNLVNSSIRGLGRLINGSVSGISHDFNDMLKNVGKAAGAIATAPATASNAVVGMFSGGVLPYNAPFLVSSTKLSYIRPVLKTGASVNPVPKSELISRMSKYSAKSAKL